MHFDLIKLLSKKGLFYWKQGFFFIFDWRRKKNSFGATFSAEILFSVTADLENQNQYFRPLRSGYENR